MCVTFTRGLSPEEVFSRYGADPSKARMLDADQASALPTGYFANGAVSLLRAGQLGDWTFCVEEDGAVGSWPEPLAALSRGTETYSMLTTEGLDVYQHWRDGECVENFEPGTPMVTVVTRTLDRLGITLDDATLAGPWPSLTLAEDDAPSAPRGNTYAGEGPVPPQPPPGD